MRKGIVASGYNAPAAALVRTNRFGGCTANPYGTGAYTSTAFTPAAGSLLVICCSLAFNGVMTLAPVFTNTGGSALTFTQRNLVQSNVSNWTDGVGIYTAPVGTAVSMTISIDHGAVSISNYAMVILEYNGQNATPIAGSVTKAAVALNGADSMTLSATPLAKDEVVVALMSDPNTGTVSASPGSTFTEQYDVAAAVSAGLHVETRTGSTSTTADWADTQTGSTDIFRNMGAAVIVKAA